MRPLHNDAKTSNKRLVIFLKLVEMGGVEPPSKNLQPHNLHA